MPRTVTFEILDEPDGRFCVVATMAPDRIYRRDGFATLGEAWEWIDGLRVLMAACGAPVIRAPARPADGVSVVTSEDSDEPHPRSFTT